MEFKWEDRPGEGQAKYAGRIYTIHTGGRSLVVTDMTDAGRTGKTVPQLRVALGDSWSVNLYEQAILALDAMQLHTKKLPPHSGGKLQVCEEEAWWSVRKANRVFPLEPRKVYKRLDAKPEKWTLPHLIRALVHGQYDDLRCRGVYTDDYAYDAAVNFQEGLIDANRLAKRIIESPSGWWVGREDEKGEMSVCCHHFDNNKVRINLEAGK